MTQTRRVMKESTPEWIAELTRIMEDPRPEIRQKVRQIIAAPALRHPGRDSVAQYRESVWKALQILADHGIGKLGIPKNLGGQADPLAFLTAFETLAEGDLSLLIKFGVQFGLFGGSIQNLGTEVHHRKYLKDAMEGTLPGCFAMTEGNHGSNVAGLETTITYFAEKDCYIVDTPNQEAGKDYIGNAALHARMASVFGQLIVAGKKHGVHCILVPIRDEQGRPLPGIRIDDDGLKMGLNGIDNGRLWFDQVEVPRENLLNRFGGVNDQGTYESSIQNESRRFFTMLGTLVGGRVSIGISGLTAAKRALRIAVDHGLARRQFGETDETETLIMDYPLHQMRLIPRLSKTFALHFALRDLMERYGEEQSADEARAFEREAAALKASSTWHATDVIQACREACGGAGYLSAMGFADLKADTDIFATFEGDNTVLQLLTAKELLKEYGAEVKSSGPLAAAINLAIGQIVRYRLGLKLLFSRVEISSQTLRELLQQRQQIVLLDTAKRIRRRLKAKGTTLAAAFNAEGPSLVELASAYTDRLAFDRFREAISCVNHQETRKKLESLLILHGMVLLEEHKAWFLTKALIPLPLCQGLPGMVRDKVAELRKDVAGFAVALTPFLNPES